MGDLSNVWNNGYLGARTSGAANQQAILAALGYQTQAITAGSGGYTNVTSIYSDTTTTTRPCDERGENLRWLDRRVDELRVSL